MEESDTYLAIIDKGEAKRARKNLLFVGERNCGPAGAAVKDELETITDLDRLDRMFQRAFEVNSWQDILDTA